MSADFDGRRRQYVPLDARLAFGRFGSRLNAEYGIEGLGVWMLLLAAAKREIVQGQFTFTSEEEAWTKLGSRVSEHSFDTFLTFFGRMKKTSRTRHGRITYVKICNWDDWNTPKPRGQNPRSEGENTNGLPQTVGDLSPDVAAEVELEVDLELESEEPLTGFRYIVATWLANAPPLIEHRASIDRSTKARKAAAKAIDSYGLDDTKTAVVNYAIVLGSELHYFSHKWTLPDFLNRGLPRFVPEAEPLENFRQKPILNGRGSQGMSVADILAMGGDDDGQRALGIGSHP